MKFSEIDFKGYKTTWLITPAAIKKLFKTKFTHKYSRTIGTIHLNKYYISFWWYCREKNSYMSVTVFERATKLFMSSVFIIDFKAYQFKDFCALLNDQISYYHRLENLQCFA
jgi:hypothetical protein